MSLPTDKIKLIKGLQTVGIAIICMFIGPIILNSSFKNAHHPLYYPVMIIGGGICLLAMYLFFGGIRKIVSSLFND